MKFKTNDISFVEILMRKLGGEQIVTMTIAANTKAGAPIDADGAVSNDNNAIGILLADVDVAENPNAPVLTGFGTVNCTAAKANYGLDYESACMQVLYGSGIHFENIPD